MSQIAVEGAPAPTHARRPMHLWVVGIVSLLWNSFGAFDYLATQLRLDFYVSNFTETQLEYFYSAPAWMDAAWAFGVWGAFVGSIGLLMARAWAVWAFGISLAGLAVSTLYNYVLTDMSAVMGSVATVMTVVIWIVALALLWYSMQQKKKGVLV